MQQLELFPPSAYLVRCEKCGRTFSFPPHEIKFTNACTDPKCTQGNHGTLHYSCPKP